MGNRTYLKIKILNIENGGFGSDDDFLAFSGEFFLLHFAIGESKNWGTEITGITIGRRDRSR